MGYYSKPPGIAWQIALGTGLFGSTELGVRFVSVLLSFALGVLSYFMSLRAGLSQRASFWASCALSFSPIGILSSFAATTDAPFVLFWMLGCLFIGQSLYQERDVPFERVSWCVAAGALFKWPIYLLCLPLFALGLRTPTFTVVRALKCACIALMGFLPSLYWNSQNEWATLRHVAASLFPSASTGAEMAVAKPLFSGKPLEFFGSQLGVASPLLFIMLLWSLIALVRKRRQVPPAPAFMGLLSLVLLCFVGILSLFNKVQANWGIFIYPTGFVYAAWYFMDCKRRSRRVYFAACSLSLLLSAIAIATPFYQQSFQNPRIHIPFKASLFRHNVGWDRLGRSLDALGYDAEEHFLFSHKYQTTSILSFYHPKQRLAYFLNLTQNRKNQFSFWPGIETQVGKTGFFVVSENAPIYPAGLNQSAIYYERLLTPYFDKVELQDSIPLFTAHSQDVKGALVFKCSNYNGLKPPSSTSY